MSRKLLYTPNSRIRQTLRQLFLRSRERAACLKHAGYTCRCGRKQSKKKGAEIKVEVHHREGVLNWEELFRAVRKYLLTDPSKMEVLCVECHKKEHE
jgi:hypothetical protein